MTISKVLASASAAAITSMTLFAIALTPVTAASAKHHAEATTADIVDTAIAAGSFKTLTAAVQAAGLEATLRSDGPFTVFAPTDEAFAKLPSGTVETLLKPENKDKLVSILITSYRARFTPRAWQASKSRPPPRREQLFRLTAPVA